MGVSWTADLSTGVAAIDEQHQELMAHVEKFVETADAGRIDELLDLLHFLGGYVELHFGTEEALMLRAAYPDLEAHRKEHAAFRKTFGELVARFARYGEDPRVGEFVRREVCAWIEQHVRTTDRAMADFFRANALG
jgi:hemerythrin